MLATVRSGVLAARRSAQQPRVVPASVRLLSGVPFRPSQVALMQHTQRNEMSVPIVIGCSLIGAGILARMMSRPKSGSDKWVKGGFQSKMDRKEAVQILGLRYVSAPLSIHIG